MEVEAGTIYDVSANAQAASHILKRDPELKDNIDDIDKEIRVLMKKKMQIVLARKRFRLFMLSFVLTPATKHTTMLINTCNAYGTNDGNEEEYTCFNSCLLKYWCARQRCSWSLGTFSS